MSDIQSILKKYKCNPMKERDSLIQALEEYYKSIDRTVTPQFHTYSIVELKKCIRLFKIVLKS